MGRGKGIPVADNILAVLARLDNSVQAIQTIVEKIAKLESPLKESASQQLLLICGLRGLEPIANK